MPHSQKPSDEQPETQKSEVQKQASESDVIQKLIYAISHDMGAPLRAVVQFTQLLVDRLEGKMDEKEHSWMALVHENGEKAQRMLQALLTYSRLSTHHTQCSSFTFASVLEVVFDDINKETVEQAIDIKVQDDLPEIYCNYSHWLQFVGALVNNALLYHPKNPDHKQKVLISATYLNNVIEIGVEDNGIGVADKHLASLTIPFRRLNLDADYPGMGMGLSYCERIAQLHQAKLVFGQSSLGGLLVKYAHPVASI